MSELNYIIHIKYLSQYIGHDEVLLDKPVFYYQSHDVTNVLNSVIQMLVPVHELFITS